MAEQGDSAGGSHLEGESSSEEEDQNNARDGVSAVEESSDQRNEEAEGPTEHSRREIENDGEVTAQGEGEDDEAEIQGVMDSEEEFESEGKLESDMEGMAPGGKVSSSDLASSSFGPGEVPGDGVGPPYPPERARKKSHLEDGAAPRSSTSRGAGVISTELSQQVPGSSEQMDQESLQGALQQKVFPLGAQHRQSPGSSYTSLDFDEQPPGTEGPAAQEPESDGGTSEGATPSFLDRIQQLSMAEEGGLVERMESEGSDEAEEDRSQLVVLDPDHPLMIRFQAALKNYLNRQIENVKLELQELGVATKQSRVQRQELGVDLYGVQQHLARLQMQLEKNHDRHSIAACARRQKEEELQSVRLLYARTCETANEERKK